MFTKFMVLLILGGFNHSKNRSLTVFQINDPNNSNNNSNTNVQNNNTLYLLTYLITRYRLTVN